MINRRREKPPADGSVGEVKVSSAALDEALSCEVALSLERKPFKTLIGHFGPHVIRKYENGEKSPPTCILTDSLCR